MSIFLALETSQRMAGIALRDHAGLVHVEMLAPKRRHDDDLMPAIDRAFSQTRLTVNDLRIDGAVAVSIGPGGFTGLRMSITIAKMLAETLGVRILAVPSAAVAAESVHADGVSNLMVALASKGESCWITRLHQKDGNWDMDSATGVFDAASLMLKDIDLFLADEFLPLAIQRHCEQAKVPIAEPLFDPRACLKIGERMLASGQTTDPLLLTPLYPREPEAVTLWNKKISMK